MFSSSTTLYGFHEAAQIPETTPIKPINPYGHTKAAVEQMQANLQSGASESWWIAYLRYSNPVGIHASSGISEDRRDIPNSLFPFVNQVAVNTEQRCRCLAATGQPPMEQACRITSTYESLGRAALLPRLPKESQLLTCTPGSGRRQSVLNVVKAMEAGSDRSIQYQSECEEQAVRQSASQIPARRFHA